MVRWQCPTLPNISTKAEEAHKQKSASEAGHLIQDLLDSEQNYHKPLRSTMTSDISFLELGQTAWVKGTVLHGPALLSDTSSQRRGPQTTLTSDHCLQVWGFSLSPQV